MTSGKSRREQRILEEIRKRVFERESQLDEQSRQALEAEINLQVLEEMTDGLTAEHIAAINQEVRREFAAKDRWKRSMILMLFILLLAAAAFLLWPRQTADIAETPAERLPAVETPAADPQPAEQPANRTSPEHVPAREKPAPLEPISDNPQLAEAVSLGLLETVKFLINNGADPATRSEKEKLPVLQLAIQKRREDIAEFLINNNAPLDATDQRGNTAMHDAAQWGMVRLIRLMHQKGAKIDAINNQQLTPLMLAAFRGQDASMQLLADLGGKLNSKDSRVTAKYLIDSRKLYFRGEHISQRQALMDPKIYPSGTHTDHGTRALMNAAYAGDLQTIRILLDLGVNVNATDRFGSTALISAAYGGKLAVAKLLVEKGAYINVRGKYGFTPLLAAVEGGCHAEFVKFLIANNADTSIKSESGNDVFIYMRGRCSRDMKAFFENLPK